MPDQNVSIAFANGIDTRTDPKYVQSGTLLSCLNGVFDKTGAIRKRHGCTALPTGTIAPQQNGVRLGPATLPPNPAARFAYGSEDCHLAGEQLYSLTEQTNAQAERGWWAEAVGTYTPLSQGATTTPIVDPDCVVINGYAVYSWTSNTTHPGLGSGDVFASVYDTSNGSLVLTTPKGMTGSLNNLTPKLIAVGTTAVLVWSDKYSYQISCATLSLATTPTAWTSPSPVQAGVVGGTHFDVWSTSATTFLLAVAAPGSFALASYNLALTPLVSVTKTVSDIVAVASVGVYANPGEQGVIAIGYANTTQTALACYGFNPTTLANVWGPNFLEHTADTTGATSVIQVGLARYSSTGTTVMWQDNNSATFGTTTIGRAVIYSTGDSGPIRTSQGLQLLSRPFVGPTGRTYAVVGLGSTSQGSLFLVDAMLDVNAADVANAAAPLRPVATLLPRQALVPAAYSAVAAFRDSGTLCHAQPFTGSATKWVCPANALAGDVPTGALQLVQLTLDWGHAGRASNALAGTVQNIGGGTPGSYDGTSIAELAFLHYPELAGLPWTLYTLGGGNVGPGTYSYVAVYEWSDAKGNFFQSSPGTPITITTVNPKSAVNCVVPLPMLSQKSIGGAATPIATVLYRTTANGTVYYRLFQGNYVPAALLSNGVGGLYTYVDAAADASITGGSVIYTTGGVLQNLCPPSFAWSWTHRGRTWGIGDDLFTVWASQAFTVGLSPGFNDAVAFTVGDGHPLTAGASMDEKCLIFTAGNCYFVIGDGPNDEGASNDWTVPQKVPGDVGCIDPRSLALIPDGIVFLSKRGLCLLTRALQIIYLDAPEDVVTAYPSVTAAIVVPEHQEVRFALNSNGATGINLVLNYFEPQGPGKYKWSVFQHYDAVAGVASSVIAAAAYVGGAYRWTSVAGNPFIEDTAGAFYMDGGTAPASWVVFSITTAWVAASGIEGLSRVKRVALNGDRYTSHDLTIAVATDYNPSTALPTGYSVTWDSDITDAAITPEELRLVVPRQKCHALQVTVTDAYPTGSEAVIGSGRGMSLSGMALRVAMKDGVGNRLPAVQRG